MARWVGGQAVRPGGWVGYGQVGGGTGSTARWVGGTGSMARWVGGVRPGGWGDRQYGQVGGGDRQYGQVGGGGWGGGWGGVGGDRQLKINWFNTDPLLVMLFFLHGFVILYVLWVYGKTILSSACSLLGIHLVSRAIVKNTSLMR